MTTPRDVAFAVLRAVDDVDAYANLLLPQLIARADLSPADAGLATELAYGTLRRRGTYDAILALVSDRDLDRIDPAVLDALRLGAHQVLSTRIASHAAVHETVELVRRSDPRATGFVNAVLRGSRAPRRPNGSNAPKLPRAPTMNVSRCGIHTRSG